MPFPNSGEMEALEALITKKTLQLILYKNLVVPTDGSLTAASLQEMPTGGGRGYAPIQLSRVINFNALTALQWFIGLNASGDAQAQYDVAPQQWIMAAQDVVDANTVQGAAAYCWVLPFSGGAIPIQEGFVLKGVTSGAIATVTGVVVLTGSWGAGTAAGFLYLETKTGPFQNGENLTVVGAIATFAVGSTPGTGYAVGDIVTPTQAGGAGAKFVVSSIGGGGAVTGLVLVDPGWGYAAAANLPSTRLTGGGSNTLTITISTLAATLFAVSNSGTLNGGDALKQLIFLAAMATPQQVTQIGQPFQSTPTLSFGTDPTLS